MRVPFEVGSGGDMLARTLFQKLGDQVKSKFIVDNNALAGGIISAEKLSQDQTDGKTIGILGDGVLNLIPTAFPKIAKTTSNSFTPISGLITINYVLIVHPSLPVKKMSEFSKLVKQIYPKTLDYAASGAPISPALIFMKDIELRENLRMTAIPLKGQASAVIELVAGRIPTAVLGIPVSLPYIKTNRLRAIAVTKNTRSFLLPNVPTVEQSGIKDFNAYSYMGLFGPKNLPASIAAKYYNDLTVLYKDKALKEKLENMGLEPNLMNQNKQLRSLQPHCPCLAV